MTQYQGWYGASLATMASGGVPYGAISDGAVVVRDDQIVWVGPRSEVPASLETDVTWSEFGGAWVTPGLVDCHTHIVYGGNRAREFELRLEGASYEEISRAGGGIVSTVRATREASEGELFESASSRLRGFLVEGVTTVEIKSGYGLDVETELRMLSVARRLGESFPVDVSTTFLGAHALPPEYADRADEYIDFVCRESLPAAHSAGLVDCVDGFCETIAFTVAQTRAVFDVAKSLGIPVKLHAEQLSDMGGSKLAAEYGAWSVDHLEYLDQAGVEAIAQSGTAAVLLPGAFYFLRETKLPPIEALRNAGVPVAIASDSNPGSSPVASLLLMLNMACTLFRMTPEEALAGVTRSAATALGAQDRIGTLSVGKQADFVVWDIEGPGELAYRIGHNPCVGVVKSGSRVLG